MNSESLGVMASALATCHSYAFPRCLTVELGGLEISVCSKSQLSAEHLSPSQSGLES